MASFGTVTRASARIVSGRVSQDVGKRGFRTSTTMLAAKNEKAPSQQYPLYPSVAHLIKEHNLDESAIGKITPTGPSGRLLKGDVLAYLGSVSADRPAEIKTRFDLHSHLDLSNIKIAAPKEAPPKAETKKPSAPEPSAVQDLVVSLPVSLAAVVEVQKKIEQTLGTFLPLSTFIARAAEVANDALPLPSNYKPTADELFNQVLGLDKVGPRGSQGYYLPQIAALSPPALATGSAPKPKAKVDIIDLLASPSRRTAARPMPSLQPGVSPTANIFSLAVPRAEEKRAKAFLQRVKVVLESEPGRLAM